MNSKNSRNKLQCVILDWAGTTVDFGCQAPTGVFIDTFEYFGVEITEAEARKPMGMHKRDHIKVLSEMPRIAAEWVEKHGNSCTEADIDKMFEYFIPVQMAVIRQHSALIPHVLDAVEYLRSINIKIGSTTGYNTAMMEILTTEASKQGYTPDCVVCASEVSAGRPAPWMIFKNANQLNIFPMQSILKIGDTISDIEEGKNAGTWTAGVVLSSNEMGLTKVQLNELSPEVLEIRKQEIRQKYYAAGADYVIDSLADITGLIENINQRLQNASKP
jgi:phosphonoacetaldehyde hydrolase